MAKLVCQTGPTAGHEYQLTKDLTILGRQSSCDVQILDNMSSRAHFQIRRDGKLFSMVDLGSRNGTNLNGKRVSERQLTFGDRIRVGEVEYLFVKEPGDVELKDLLSKYEVQEKIGEGGMGIVYKANQRSMNRIVALKILSPKYSARPRFVDQFIKEARAAGQLNHPNIIQVHDVGTENDIHYFSMEFVDGPTCMQALRQQGPFRPTEALEIIRQTAKALEYAHSQRLIHQDIKPDNIMLGANNSVKLADLGISKTFDEAESEEGPKRVMGTPHYMAPEAALGKKIDQRVDIYSLGATLYHLLTGKTPYTGTSATEVLKAHVMDPLPAIHDIVPDVPENVCALVERMVAKKPEDRYQAASEVVAEIQRLQAGGGLGTERIAGGETMLLRRYASGTPGPNTNPTPSAATTGTRPRGQEDGATTAERPSLQRKSGAGSLVSGAVLITIVVLLGLAAWHFLGNVRVNDKDPAPPIPNPTTTKTPIPVTPSQPDPPKPSDNGAAQRQAQALAALEDQLKTKGDQADLNAIRAQVDDLRSQGLVGTNQEAAKLLLDRIEKLQQGRRAAAAEQDFATLKQETQKLADEHNYELALNRIEAFKGKAEPNVKDRVNSLGDDIKRAQETYLGNLRNKIQLIVSQKSLPRLKDLRDQLPPALIDSPIDQEIQAAMKTIENEQLAQQQAIVQRAATELAKWNFAAVDDLVRTWRTGMGSSAAGKQLDTYAETAHRLAQLVDAIANQLKIATRYPRFHGNLKGWTDPDMISADAQGLQLQVANGGTTSPHWQDIPPDALLTITKLVLPKEEAEQYRAAIEVLGALKPAKE